MSSGPSFRSSGSSPLPDTALLVEGTEWHLEAGTVIGTGGFGCVHLARGPGGRRAACKAVDTAHLEDRMVTQLDVEVEAVRRAQTTPLHPHIVRLLGTATVGSWRLIFMEESAGDILSDVLSSSGLDEDRASRVMRQVLSALVCCHRLGIRHGDVKPENILVGRDRLDDVKLADFGSASLPPAHGDGDAPPASPASGLGTALYSAPEVLRASSSKGGGSSGGDGDSGGEAPEAIGLAADIWSVGVCTFVLLSGLFPFSSASDTLYRRASFAGEPWASRVTPAAPDFIRAALRHEPARRPTAAEALRHPWLLPPVRCETPPPAAAAAGGSAAARPAALVTPTKRRREPADGGFARDGGARGAKQQASGARTPLVPL